jgi:hypothetical protein
MGHEGISNANAAALTGSSSSSSSSSSDSDLGSAAGSSVSKAPLFTDDFTSGGAENDEFAASMRAPRSLRALADLDLNLSDILDADGGGGVSGLQSGEVSARATLRQLQLDAEELP